MNENFFYIYNPHQAEHFRTHGIEILEIGKGKKGDVYVKFPRNENSEKVFSTWIEKCKQIREIMNK